MLLVLLGAGACERTTPIERLGRIEVRRDADARYLLAALGGSSAGIRARAARTAGRIHAASLLDPLVPLLVDSDPAVRTEASFALGEIARARRDLGPRVASHLVYALERMSPMPETPVAEAVAALGKAVAVRNHDVLRGFVTDGRPAVASAAVLAYAEIGFSLGPSELVAMTQRSNATLRWEAYYAAGRQAPPELLTRLAAGGLVDSTAAVRAMAARALARSSDPHAATELILEDLAGELDAWVLVELIRTLGRLGDPEGLPAAARYVHSQWPEVRAQAASAVARDARLCTEVLDDLLLLVSDRDAVARGAVARALARVPDASAAAALRSLAVDDAALVREAALRALAGSVGIQRGAALAIVRAALDDPDGRVASAALETLASMSPGEAQALAGERVRSSDLAIVVGAVRVLATVDLGGWDDAKRGELAALYSPACRPPVKIALVRALSRVAPDDPCVLAPLMDDPLPGVRALAYRTAAPVGRGREMACRLPTADHVYRTSPVAAARHYPDADRLPTRAELMTDRGRVVIELFPREAPLTVAHVSALARTGFYDGLVFHVANADSVVAFGCPRGDGFGDPALAVPAEIGRRPITSGTVALYVDEATGAGDSRVFIALRPLPELRGAHTVFGTVVGGLERARRTARGQALETFSFE